jgi:hypothetical protein
MASRDIIPGTDAEIGRWILHFASKIDTHAPALAITKADVQQLKDDAATIAWTLSVLTSVRATAQQVTAYKNSLFDGEAGPTAPSAPIMPTFAAAPTAVPAGAISRTRNLVQRIKRSPGYTDAIGKDLELITPAPQAPTTEPKPTFTLAAFPGSHVRADWVKGSFSGVVIQCKRPGDADFITIGQDLFSPYDDKRPPVTGGTPETRQYRMRYLKKDDEVGEWSDIVSVVTIP